MASSESKTIRLQFVKDPESLKIPFETKRRDWEESACQVPLPSDVTIQPQETAGIYCERITVSSKKDDSLIFYLHGGGYTEGSCLTHRRFASNLARKVSVPLLLVDYPLAPEHPFPEAIESTVKVYQSILEQGIDPQKIVFAGDSAGGGLSVAVMMTLREKGLPLPGGLFIMSPWLDLTLSGESFERLRDIDPNVFKEALEYCADNYMNGQDKSNVLASPVLGDFHHFPPTLVHVGSHEILLSESILFEEKAKKAGVDIQLEVWDEMWHVWHGWAGELPEADKALQKAGAFIRRLLQVNE